MKTIGIVFLVFFATTVLAQRPEIKQVTTEESNTTFMVLIPQTNSLEVEKHWRQYVSGSKRGKASVINGVMQQNGILVSNISNLPFEVYSKRAETLEGVYQTVWFTQNNQSFISADASSIENLTVQKYIQDFATQEYRNALTMELKYQENIHKEMNMELNALIKAKEQSKSKILENSNSSQYNSEAIEVNELDIENAADRIQEQKEMVEFTATDHNAQEGAKKTLHQLETEKKDLQIENQKRKNSNNDLENENKARQIHVYGVDVKMDTKMQEIYFQEQKLIEIKRKIELTN
jgi:hypothetical protein